MAVDSVAIFKKAIPGANTAILSAVKDTLSANASKFGLTTQKRISAFMSQAAVESASFTTTREIWGPTARQKGYEGRADLGNTVTGDGYKFMGRGIFQITGRANYRTISQRIFGDDRLLTNPAILEDPHYATLSALYYWSDRNLNQYADANDITGLTKRINGGTTALTERINFWNSLNKVISTNPVAFLADFLKKKSGSTGFGNIVGGFFDGLSSLFGSK